MSGLEIGALVAGIVGASAAAISGAKAGKELSARSRDASYQSVTEKTVSGHSKQTTWRVASTSGDGFAEVTAGGDLIVASQANGTAYCRYESRSETLNSNSISSPSSERRDRR
ncbi:hypothetical protein MKZ38_007211 [Zalerion maritima]|uniref:Uncharacterized protein n=1 Tax=Zalerion maritima TaxID=339359 RepID=A0AAD5RI81_9PEZI|nr:hypothetical protein MKZ38_007211 [Zalerion maritima]